MAFMSNSWLRYIPVRACNKQFFVGLFLLFVILFLCVQLWGSELQEANYISYSTAHTNLREKDAQLGVLPKLRKAVSLFHADESLPKRLHPGLNVRHLPPKNSSFLRGVVHGPLKLHKGPKLPHVIDGVVVPRKPNLSPGHGKVRMGFSERQREEKHGRSLLTVTTSRVVEGNGGKKFDGKGNVFVDGSEVKVEVNMNGVADDLSGGQHAILDGGADGWHGNRREDSRQNVVHVHRSGQKVDQDMVLVNYPVKKPVKKPVHHQSTPPKDYANFSETSWSTTIISTTLDPDDPYVGSEFPIYRAASPTKGWPWPLPKFIQTNRSVIFDVKTNDFHFSFTGVSCDLLNKATDRYLKDIVGFGEDLQRDLKLNLRHSDSMTLPSTNILTALDLNIRLPCDSAWPSSSMDEWYAIVITPDKALLQAEEVWGALRGLETFRQLLYIDGGQIRVNYTMIEDAPRFSHRGMLVDTGRHYLSISTLLQNLEAMSQNKLNVLHWHMVDDQSFPFFSEKHPEFSQQGAFHPTMVYRAKDINQIVEYARERGIRVIPEFDTPGHTRSWGHAHPEILTDCVHNTVMGPLDPLKESTYDILRDLYEDITSIFKDSFLHLGGDETSFSCWSRNPNITRFLTEKGESGNFAYLEKYYFDRLLDIISSLGKNTSHIVWQEVFDNDVQLPKDTIIEIWKGNDPSAVINALNDGYRVIFSSCWYLNYIKYSTSWHKYYLCDPQSISFDDNSMKDMKKNIIGGEACLWGEFLDDNTFMITAWPRALAVAERLWSPEDIKDPHRAEGRFEEQNCRLRSRGVVTSPENGPSSCVFGPNYHKSAVKSFIPDHIYFDV